KGDNCLGLSRQKISLHYLTFQLDQEVKTVFFLINLLNYKDLMIYCLTSFLVAEGKKNTKKYQPIDQLI
ncbi:MAG: hypothetical protein ABW158_09155, partial [Candidatus Thiodiazotropha sp. 6PDIVS]